MANWAEQTKHRGGAAVDTISELTSGAGVTADGVLLKDSQVTADVINEKTAGAGVTADGVQMKDGNLETVAVEQLTQQGSTPATPAAGKTKLYVKTDGVAYILNPDGIETPIGSGSTVERVTQATHGFAVGEALYYTGAAYAKAMADDSATAEVVCMVSRVIDANTFEFVTNGIVEKTAWGLTAGEVYFLSDTTAGAITTTEPTTVSYISKPLLIATSTTSGVFVNMRGTTVGGTNLYTTIPLNNGAATTILNLADDTTFPVGSSGELVGGGIKILQSGANTDYSFAFRLMWTKQSSTVVDIQPDALAAIPPGFAFGTSGAAITVSFTALGAFESGECRYTMNAAPIGAQLPLQIASSQVTWDVTTLTNTDATQLGLKQYLHGTTYNGGNAPTVTSAQAGFSVVRADFVPYKAQGGEWRLRFNISSSITSATISSVSVAINGITTKNVASFYQPCAGFTSGASANLQAVYANPNNNTLAMYIASTAGITGLHFSGDIELDSKPTWAY